MWCLVILHAKMKINRYGEIIYSEDDIFQLLMQGREIQDITDLTVDTQLDKNRLGSLIPECDAVMTWERPESSDMSVVEFDSLRQKQWYMPDEYKNLDIAEHVLSLCQKPEELQRCGQELLLYQERDLFNLLRYLKYLVDTMRKNHVTWGVGRGSSVASFVLYKLGVHRIDSLYYDLDPKEFLR